MQENLEYLFCLEIELFSDKLYFCSETGYNNYNQKEKLYVFSF